MKKILGILLGLFLASNVFAADGTYTNTAGDRKWSTAGNWAGSTIATGASATAYFVAGIGTYTITNNTTGWIIGSYVASNNAGVLTITGGTNILNSANSTSTFNAITSRQIVMNNVLQGTNTLYKTGAGQLTLNGVNTYSGGTVIDAGTLNVTNDTGLGATGGQIRFMGNSTFNMSPAVTLFFDVGRTITVDSAITATISSGNGTKVWQGPVNGAGNLTWASTTTLTLTNANNGLTGNYNLNMDNANYGFEMASISDSAEVGTVNLGTTTTAGGLRWVGSGVDIVLTNRQFALTGTTGGGVIRQLSTNALTILKPLKITGTGAKSLTLAGTNTRTNIFSGAITNGSGSVISVAKEGVGTWAIGGASTTNTFTGGISLSVPSTGAGTLIICGTNAITGGGTITMNQNSSSTSGMKVLDDGTGTNLFTCSITLANLNSSSGIQLTVGNNNTANGGYSAGATTGATIAFPILTFNGGNTAVPGFSSIVSLNNYSVQFNEVDFMATPGAANWAPTFGNGGCIVKVNGAVQQLAGCVTAGRNIVFTLDGTASNNIVIGNILDTPDFYSNDKTLPLAVTKQGTGTWILSGTNTYSGATRVTAGKLTLTNNASVLPYVTDLYLSTGVTNNLNFTGTNKIRSLYLNAVLQPNGTYGTNGVTYTNTTYFTGNGVLDVGQYTAGTNYFWTNLVGGSFSQAGNWTNTTTTTQYAPTSFTNNNLNFLATGNKTITNDIIGEFILQDLDFANAAYTLTGNGLSFTNGHLGSPDIDIGDVNSQIINMPIRILGGATLIIGGSGAGNLTITNYIGGAGSINKTNATILSLGQATSGNRPNTFTGSFSMSDGKVALPSVGGGALGTGPFILNGGTIRVDGNNIQTLSNSVYTISNNFAVTASGGNGLTLGVGNMDLATNATINSSITTVTISSNITGAYGITFAGSNTFSILGTNGTYTGKTIVQTNTTLSGGNIRNVGQGISSLGAPTTIDNGKIDIYDNGKLNLVSAVSFSSDRIINFVGTVAGSTNFIRANANDCRLTLTSPILFSGSGTKLLSLYAGGDRTLVSLGPIPNNADGGNVSVLSDCTFSSSTATNNVIFTGTNLFTGSLTCTNSSTGTNFIFVTGMLAASRVQIGGGTASNIFSTVTNNAINTYATVDLRTRGRWFLNFTGTNTIGMLQTNGVNLALGTYGTNAVTYTNTIFFSGNGIINITGVTNAPSGAASNLLVPYLKNELWINNQLGIQ